MKKLTSTLLIATPIVLALAGAAALTAAPQAHADAQARPAAQAALTVNLIRPQTATLPLRIHANGNIAAWQEASIGTEAGGLRLVEVRVNVGDRVRRGQLLASFASATVAAELAHSRAALAEARAALAEAGANAQRARGLQASGALSAQQIGQYLTAETLAQARLEAAEAMAQTQALRLAQTQVLAPDDGVISARSATVGAVLPAGQELFRLIRQSRLEWRAEVPAPELARLKPGQAVSLSPVGGSAITGRLRQVAPTVDPATRNGLVYVDLPAGSAARAGMFARGEIQTGTGQPQLTLPQAAVLQRDGYSVVLRVGADAKVRQTQVSLGQRAGDRVEILAGLDAGSQVVASGGVFLADGDLVKVVDAR